MNWIRVKDKTPPLNKKVLYGFIEYLGDRNEFKFFIGLVDRPFDKNIKWNPNYYSIHFFNSFKGEYQERDMDEDDYWMEVEQPNE